MKKCLSEQISRLTQIALLFALSIVLMLIESAIPPIPTLPPGVKIGLSNIVVMYAVIYLGKSSAFSLLVVKSLFVFITRGAVASILSFSGGFFSIAIMFLLLLLKNNKISYIMISMFASIAHNLGQLLVAGILLKTIAVFYYTPVLVVSGVFMGILTGTILKVMLPAMKRLDSVRKIKNKRLGSQNVYFKK